LKEFTDDKITIAKYVELEAYHEVVFVDYNTSYHRVGLATVEQYYD